MHYSSEPPNPKPGDTWRDEHGFFVKYVAVDAQRLADIAESERIRRENWENDPFNPMNKNQPKYPGGPPPDWDG